MRRALTLVGVLGLVATAALMLGRPAGAQVLGGSAVNATGRSNRTLSAPRYISTAASGSNGFACTVDGCRFDLGTGANDYWYSNGSAPSTPGVVNAGGFYAVGAGSLPISSRAVDGATAIGVKIQNVNALTTAGAKIVSFYSDNGTTERAAITKDGAIKLGGSAGAAPTCEAATRGIIYYTPGAAGVLDKLEICRKDAADAYAWVSLF